MKEQNDPQNIQLPIKQTQRKQTDCCWTVISTFFVLIMFILASLLWNQNKLVHVASFITGQKYKQCAQVEYIYFQKFMDFQSSKCVKQCPQNQQGFCMISGQGSKSYHWNSKIYSLIQKNQGFIQTITYVFIIALGWGMLKMTITQWFPRHVAILSYVLGVGLLLIYSVFVLATSVTIKLLGKWNLWFGIFLIVLALILTVMMCMYSREIKFHGYMLEYAVTYLNQNPITFISIPLFFLLHLGLISLMFWQYICFSSYLTKSIVVWKFTLSQILDVLTLIEYLWGLQFLRDSFNFCVSGNAVDWYWTKNVNYFQPYQRLICKYWGSVVAGSFLNCFFQIPTLITQVLICHPGTCCSSIGNICYDQLSVIPCFFERVRTDVYSYINLTGKTFCQSAAECSNLCGQTNLFVGYHSAMKHHRFSAHVGSICFVFAWAYWIMNLRTTNYDWHLHVILLVFAIYTTVTWFIGIHADVGQGLQTCYLVEFQIQRDYKYMQHLLPSVRKILQPIQHRVEGDGNC